MSAVIQYILYLAVLIALAIPLGTYIKKVMNGGTTFLSRILTPCENAVYKVMRVKKDEQMTWKKYAVSVLIFSGLGLVFLFLLQILQGILPGNPQGLRALNIMGLHSPQSAVLSAIIYNALIIIALIPLALKGVKYREVPAGRLLSRNLFIYGLGGLAAPFIFIKLIDMLLVLFRLA